MRVVHTSDEASRTLATSVETADSFLSRARGLMFRRSIPDEYALAFRFDGTASRDVHMAFVRFPIDAVWTVDGTVRRVDRLRPWDGLDPFAEPFAAEADVLFELPAGNADGVETGDSVRLVD